MKLIIEGYSYPADQVRSVLSGLSTLENVEHKVQVNYVGYFYNSDIEDCVFVLPKVLVNEQGLAFNHIDPIHLIDVEQCSELTAKERQFIYEFAVWIYRCIVVYNEGNPNNEIVYYRRILTESHGQRQKSQTLLDVIKSLLNFNRDNQDYFTTILKNIHAGFNKINWTRTVSHAQVIVKDGTAIYLNPVNKKRMINFDEELLVIFFSILNHVNRHYGFPVHLTLGYDLITDKRFEHYLQGYGKTRLRQIKYRYYSDKALKLWELCDAYFDITHQIYVNKQLHEYLLVKDFYHVFEAMIDELIGDKDIPAGLKDQADGKRVDHMYRYRSLTTHEEDKDIYYIGDSKYYKLGNKISHESVYKQYTYARNVIQWDLDLFMSGQSDHSIRDERTEGYNVIPNFFISARMDDNLSYNSDIYTTAKEDKFYESRQFTDRLFDRDTLLVCHYDVNFLYVVSLYARNNAQSKRSWRDKVRARFREEISRHLEEEYGFYAMKPRIQEDADNYMSENFQKVLGKVYKPFSDGNITSLALSKREDNEALLNELRQYFYVEECPLGCSPYERFLGKETLALGTRLGDCLLSGYIKKENQDVAWREQLYYIPAFKSDKSVSLLQGFDRVKYIMLYNGSHRTLHRVKGKPTFISGKSIKDKGFSSSGDDFDMYIAYNISPEPITLPNIDINTIPTHRDHTSPIVVSMENIMTPKQ